ncbi:MAG: D-inositol-3-phosphate glycosyltransferase [Mycobacterium sp.]|jgi:glycosyltransferase involved in cell wall biosynthesis|nr:D-inositol-3-phosphate glycosyltransferase [Mycobacterium sp.]
MGEPIRVLVLDQAVGVWGAQRYVLRLAPLLRERGVELTLGVPRSLEVYEVWRKTGFPVIDLDLPIYRSIRNAGRPSAWGIGREAWSGLRTVRLIANELRRTDYDAVWSNAHWLHLEASLAGIICKKPAVLHLHEESMPGLATRLRASAVRLAARSVSVSKAVATGLPASVRDRVSVIPNGVDVEANSPEQAGDHTESRQLRATFGIGTDDVMVLAGTRLDPDKRVEDLIQAIQKIDDARVRLVVAGVTSRFPDYERAVRAEGAALPSGRVTFCGNRDDMSALLRASDLFVHAGVVEGMPLGMLEAQSCAKPVVGYRVAGVPEAVIDGTTGLLAAAGDVHGLCTALDRLVHDPGLRAQMGSAARSHVLANYNIETQATRNAKVLTDLRGQRGRVTG